MGDERGNGLMKKLLLSTLMLALCAGPAHAVFIGDLQGNADTATALSANPANCGAGNYARGIDADGAGEDCTPDDDVPDAGDFGNATDLDANGALNTDSVSANELNATGVEAELEAVMDLQDMQGAVTDGQVPDTLTASNYLPLAGGTMTGSVLFSNLGIEFTDSDTNPTCGAGEFKIFADLSEGKLKKCSNGSVTDLDTTGGTPAFSTLTGGTNTAAAMVVGTGASLSASGSGTITATGVTCTDCIDETQVQDIYALNAGDTISGVYYFQGVGTGANDAYDIVVGNDADPEYGAIRIGNMGIYSSNFSSGNLNLDGAMVFRSEGNLAVGNDPGIEFAISESGANTMRLMIPESGAGNAMALIRSVTIAGPYSAAVGNDMVLCDQWSAFDGNIDCDTGSTGADLFVQDDAEIEGTIFVHETINFEGATADGNQVILQVGADPGSDITITLPTATSTLAAVGGNLGAATATTPSANDNDTSVATTAYVQTELSAYNSDSATFTNKQFDADGTGNSIINIESADIKNGGIGDVDIADTADIKTGGFGVTIDGGGSAITTGVKGYAEVPYDCTIEQVTMLADQSGSAVVDIWVDTYANYPPTDADSITASAVPTISTAIKSQDSTLTGWTTTVSAGDIVGFNVDSAATIERLTVNVVCGKD